jgi:hypothetical protein
MGSGIAGEVVHCRGHSHQALRAVNEHLAHLETTGASGIDE